MRAHSVRQEPLNCLRSRVSVNQPTGLLRQSRVASADARRLYCDNQDATSASVRRQRLWDQIGDLSNEGCLAHRNPKESEDVPEILSPLPPVRRPKSCRAIFAVLRASTITPRNLVLAIPTTTELPMLFIAFMDLSYRVPLYLKKFIPIWLQNSTPNPSDVTRFTTKTAFISIG